MCGGLDVASNKPEIAMLWMGSSGWGMIGHTHQEPAYFIGKRANGGA